MKKIKDILLSVVKIKNGFYFWAIALLSVNFYFMFGENKGIFLFWILFFFSFFSLLVFILFKRFYLKGEKITVNLIQISVVFISLIVSLINFDFSSNLSVAVMLEFAWSVINVCGMLGITGLFFLAAYGIGSKIFSKFRLENITYTENVLSSIGLGIGVFAYVFYLMSVLQMAYPAVAYGLLGFSFLFCFKNIKDLIRRLFKMKIELDVSTITNNLAYLLFFSIIAVGLVLSLATLMSAQWDTFHQYLTFPTEYANNHGLVQFKFHPHWGFPQAGEMIFLAGLLLGGKKVAFLINAVFFLLTLLGLRELLKSFGNKNSFWIVLLASTSPLLIIFYSGYLKIELMLLFYLVLIYIWLWKFFSSQDKRKAFLLLAIFLGLSLAIKYTSALFIFSVVLALLIFRDKLGVSIKKLVFLAGIILLLFLPWGIKNIIYYGNPVYPISAGNDFCYQELGIQCHKNFIENSNEDVALVNDNHELKMGHKLFSNVMLLLKVFSIGNGFSSNSPGPWFLIFFPWLLVYFFKIKSDFVRFVYYLSGIYLIFWLIFLSGQMWYLLPFLLGYLIILGYIFEKHVDLESFKFIKMLIVIWGFLIAFLILSPFYLSEKALYIKEKISIDQAWIRMAEKAEKNSGYFGRVDSFKMWEFIDKNVIDKESRAIIYGFMDTQGYFIKDSYKTFIPDFFGYLFNCLYENGDVYGKLKKLNVRYILNDADYFKACEIDNRSDFKICETQKRFRDFIKENNLPIVHQEGEISLYELK